MNAWIKAEITAMALQILWKSFWLTALSNKTLRRKCFVLTGVTGLQDYSLQENLAVVQELSKQILAVCSKELVLYIANS